jgi:hypothetical protein
MSHNYATYDIGDYMFVSFKHTSIQNDVTLSLANPCTNVPEHTRRQLTACSRDFIVCKSRDRAVLTSCAEKEVFDGNACVMEELCKQIASNPLIG